MDPTVIICIDGLGKDLISLENTPFLYEFGKNNLISRLETLFAFTGIEYCFFSGKEPDKTKIWLEFEKSKRSIFNNPLIRLFSFNKKLRTYLGAFIQLFSNRTYIAGLHNIPKNMLKYFDTSSKKGLWEKEYFKDKNFVFYKWPFFIQKDENKLTKRLVFKYEKDNERLKRLMKPLKKEIYYTQLMEVDKAIHKYGKWSEEVKVVLKNLDRTLKKHISKALKLGLDIIIWSDHGFADIDNYIDIQKLLPKRNDYFYFIAGTTVSFWFKTDIAKKEITEILRKIKIGEILDKKTAERYRIPFLDKYGELIFYIPKGNYFFPNFYQKNENEKFKSMHGYPEDPELDGFFMTNKKVNITKDKALKMNEVYEFL